MLHRALPDIDRDIADLRAKLKVANDERRAAVRAKIFDVIAAFDAGASNGDLCDRFGMSDSAIRGILRREGRTFGGRTAIAIRIREAVGRGAST
jgi:hypothetical protein